MQKPVYADEMSDCWPTLQYSDDTDSRAYLYKRPCLYITCVNFGDIYVTARVCLLIAISILNMFLWTQVCAYS